ARLWSHWPRNWCVQDRIFAERVAHAAVEPPDRCLVDPVVHDSVGITGDLDHVAWLSSGHGAGDRRVWGGRRCVTVLRAPATVPRDDKRLRRGGPSHDREQRHDEHDRYSDASSGHVRSPRAVYEDCGGRSAGATRRTGGLEDDEYAQPWPRKC